MPAYWVLAAQIVVQACLMAVTLALLITVSIVFFGISAPKSPAAMVLAIALTMAALFAIGLAIAALARTSGAARGLMAAALYPMMFFSGLVLHVVFTTTFHGDLYALNAATGAILLETPLSAGTNAPVTVDGDYVIAGAGVPLSKAQQPQIIAYKLGATGKLSDTVGS